MSCNKYEQYELGNLDEKEFQIHVKSCPECQAFMRDNKIIMNGAQRLNKYLELPDLWPAIENRLSTAKKVKPLYKSWIIRIAAVLILGSSLTLYFYNQEESTATMILNQSALKKVEKTEQEYIKAIAELQKHTQQSLFKIDIEIASLYRTKIEAIDIQIERCKMAVQHNPANIHIRKYLLAALQDKRETLHELLKYDKSDL
jgi:hypothetical protein